MCCVPLRDGPHRCPGRAEASLLSCWGAAETLLVLFPRQHAIFGGEGDSLTPSGGGGVALHPGCVIICPFLCGEGDKNEVKPREISDDQDFSFQGEAPASVLEHKRKSLHVNARPRASADPLTPFQMLPQLTGHLEDMLQTAYSKFHAWQTRRMMRKT